MIAGVASLCPLSTVGTGRRSRVTEIAAQRSTFVGKDTNI